MLYKMINLPSDEPVQYVGVYVLKWGRATEPTVAFREATQEEIYAEQNKEEYSDDDCLLGGVHDPQEFSDGEYTKTLCKKCGARLSNRKK